MATLQNFLVTAHVEQKISLRQDESSCYICLVDFNEAGPTTTLSKNHIDTLLLFAQLPFAQLQNQGFDEPVRLPCHHVIGSSCLFLWIEANGNTCPFCRASLFDRAEHPDPFQEYQNQRIARESMPLRELLKADLDCDEQVLLDQQRVTLFQRRLLNAIVNVALRFWKLDDIPLEMDSWALSGLPGNLFTEFVQNLFIINDGFASDKQLAVLEALDDSETARVFEILCQAVRDYSSIAASMSTCQLFCCALRVIEGHNLGAEQYRIVSMSLKACIAFEGRQWSLMRMLDD